MCFSGHDPSGGAGIVADIEAIKSMGCFAAPVITAHTVQDTRGVKRFECQSPELFYEQASIVLDDFSVAAFKIGMLGNTQIVAQVRRIIDAYPDCPVILDPVLAAGADDSALAEDDMLDALRNLLLPRTFVITPNSIEARRLAPNADTLTACAEALQDDGCEYVLITGTHEDSPEVINTLYANHRVMEEFHWTRLPHAYHGSGCTLSASIAALLAHGLEPYSAIHEAQEYTWQTLEHGLSQGKGQRIPHRLFWADDDAQ